MACMDEGKVPTKNDLTGHSGLVRTTMRCGSIGLRYKPLMLG